MKENEIKKLESEIHHEFQLERAILFSDAVFAIAITLMVIELKFPEIKRGATREEIWSAIAPVIRNFMALTVSFFFIGMYWYRHLKLCALLIDFNRTFIILNLLFLFFIVLFPFSASTMMQVNETIRIIPSAIYAGNIFFATLTHFILYAYVLGKGRSISKNISSGEKKLLLEESFTPIVIIVVIFTTFFLSLTLLQTNSNYAALIYLPAIFILYFFRRTIKRRRKKIREALISESEST